MTENTEQTKKRISPQEILQTAWRKRNYCLLTSGLRKEPDSIIININLRDELIDHIIYNTSIPIIPHHERIFGMKVIWALNVPEDDITVTYSV